MEKERGGYVEIAVKRTPTDAQEEPIKFEVSSPIDDDANDNDERGTSSREIEEVTLEDVTTDIKTTPRIAPVDTNDDTTDETVENKEETSPAKKYGEKKKPSRAETRIRQLHAEKVELQQRLEAAEREKFDLSKRMSLGEKGNKEAMKAALEHSLGVIRKGMQDAIENGEAAESVKLNEELIQTRAQLSDLTKELDNYVEVQAPPKKPTYPQEGVPEKALEWIDVHPEFKTDELFYVSSLTVSKQLIKEGYDDKSDDFYEELDARLSPRFPELFGMEEENVVKYDNKDKNPNTSNEDEDENKEPSSSNKRQTIPEQTVSGASRASTQSRGTQKRGKDSVTLSPTDVRQAERFGLSLEQYARRIAHNSKNRRNDGYVEIKLKK